MRCFKNLVCFVVFFVSLLVHGQTDYPKPPINSNHLFYIQHSNNHNTFVYEANLIDKKIDLKKPINIYRIVYTEGGVKKALSEVQRKMAYGVSTKFIKENHFEFNLVVSNDLLFNLVLDTNGKPKVYTTIDGKKLYVNRIFIKIKPGSKTLKPDVENVTFEGLAL